MPIIPIPASSANANPRQLLKAIKKRPGASQEEIDQEAVLLRAYGKGTDVLIDRESKSHIKVLVDLAQRLSVYTSLTSSLAGETRSHSLLASRGLAPPLLAKFKNGLLYKFIAGDVCTPADLQRPEIYCAVARRLAQWHSTLPISAISSHESKHNSKMNGGTNAVAASRTCTTLPPKTSRPQPNLWTVVQAWIDALPRQTEEEIKRNAILGQELASLSSELGNTPGLDGHDYIFSHCDLLSGNVIVTDSKSDQVSVDFIDYEYAMPAPAAFDIANHFAEWGGFDCDYNALPTHSQRQEFLSEYLRSYRHHAPVPNATTAQFDEELEQLMSQVDLFRGIPGFYWGIWALIQAQISQIDFDYASYAEIRLGEYWAWKAERDGSRSKAGKEIPLRERRWAEE